MHPNQPYLKFCRILILFTCLAALSSAQDAPAKAAAAPPSNPFNGNFLFGDWGGPRLEMEKKGINFDASFTQFGQDLANRPEAKGVEYGNHFDLFLNFDTEKLGMWKGGGIGGHFEIRTGDALKGVSLFPANSALFMPFGIKNRGALASLYLTQKIGSSASLMIGRICAVDLLASAPFIGGRGIDGFMNIVFVAPPSGVTPIVTYGALLSKKLKNVSVSLFVYDPTDQSSWKTRPFAKGTNFSFGLTIPSKSFGHNATHAFNATFSTQTGTNLADIPQLILPPGDRQIGTRQGPFNISYQYEQYLYQSPANPKEGFGLFVKAAIADGNPNIIQTSFFAGLGGTGLIRRRSIDRFGVGFFNYQFSNALRDAVRPVVSINNERGAELFYNYALTRWFRVTGDFQILPPTIADRKTTYFFAVRGKLSF